jgi:hypothetical protein
VDVRSLVTRSFSARYSAVGEILFILAIAWDRGMHEYQRSRPKVQIPV